MELIEIKLHVQENKLEVAEMRMVRWMCGVTKLDKIRNERIKATTKVEEIAKKKVQERMLKWYGNVMRTQEDYVGRRVMEMKVQGRRKRGGPTRRWLDIVRDDIKEKGLLGRNCTTVLHGGVCHRTSTTHKSRNKMKRKKYLLLQLTCDNDIQFHTAFLRIFL